MADIFGVGASERQEPIKKYAGAMKEVKGDTSLEAVFLELEGEQ